MIIENILSGIKKDRILWPFFIIFLLFVFTSFLAPIFLTRSPFEVHEEFLNIPPFWMEGGNSRFILGTDDLGRDLFVRLVYGARISMKIGFLVIVMSLSAGTILGLLAGYLGGKVDQMVMRFVDILMSFPSILISILIVTVLGPGLLNAIIAVNVTAWPEIIRVVRSVVLREREKDYVQALRNFGSGKFRILIFNILPNCTAPIIVQATLGFSDGILNVAALGFLGLGAEPPLPEWGVMISDGRAYMETAWWLITLPGFLLFALVLSVNIIGESFRDILDPKS